MTQAFGLACTGPIVSMTGIAGFTLGGGFGWLHRKIGLGCDNLESATVVTAHGDLVTASETENRDLYWGLCGSGWNFGVVISNEPILFLAQVRGPCTQCSAPEDLARHQPHDRGSGLVHVCNCGRRTER